MTFIIVSRGPAATPGADYVIDPGTGDRCEFATRVEAGAYRDLIKPDMPSKYYPLVVVEASPTDADASDDIDTCECPECVEHREIDAENNA